MARLSLLALLTVALAGFSQTSLANNSQALTDIPVHTTEGWDWKDCGLPTDVVQIESIQVSPDPPQPGHDLTVTVKARAQETVEDGAYVNVVVKLGLIKLLQKRLDVCDEARTANASVQCPVEPGYYEVVQTVALPKEIPKAKFTVHVDGWTVDEEALSCIHITVDFMKNPFLHLINGW